MRQIRNQNGFILATVLLFLIVLSVTAFFAAAMTRTDVQVVNNVQNEKEALAIAEAGIHEALYRMSMQGTGAAGAPGAHPVTIGGTSINPSLSPRLPDRDNVTGGASPYGIDYANTSSTTQILLNTTAPVQGTDTTVPTLQQVASRLSYTESASDTNTPLTSSANLKMGWELCAAGSTTPAGCDACNPVSPLANCATVNAGVHIRRLPLSAPRPVVKLVSTGQSGNARQKVTVWAVDINETSSCATCPDSFQLLGDLCTQGITMNGSTSLTALGGVTINAGTADSTSDGLCEVASTGGSHSVISASEINVAGTVDGNFTPSANEGSLPKPDPLANLQPPCFGLNTANCQNVGATQQNPTGCTGSATNPQPCSVSSVTLTPGIYYGGLRISGNTTLSPGVYIIAGGGIQMSTGNTGTTSIGTGGVTIYNTQNDNPAYRTGYGAFGQFSIGNGNATASLVATTTGYYAGISLFQDRDNTLTLDFQGGNSGHYTYDGTIYAPNAGINLDGHTNQTIGGSLIIKGPATLGGGSNISINAPSTPCAQCVNNQGVLYVPIAWQDFPES